VPDLGLRLLTSVADLDRSIKHVIQACGRHGITLLAVPAETSFATVTEEVGRQLNGDRATAMSRVLGRRRLLLSAVAEGAGLDTMFRLMRREIATECWLLTWTGRVVGEPRISSWCRDPPGPGPGLGRHRSDEDERARQHRALPDQADRRAHRPEPIAPG
jgi:hypothetical protein